VHGHGWPIHELIMDDGPCDPFFIYMSIMLQLVDLQAEKRLCNTSTDQLWCRLQRRGSTYADVTWLWQSSARQSAILDHHSMSSIMLRSWCTAFDQETMSPVPPWTYTGCWPTHGYSTNCVCLSTGHWMTSHQTELLQPVTKLSTRHSVLEPGCHCCHPLEC